MANLFTTFLHGPSTMSIINILLEITVDSQQKERAVLCTLHQASPMVASYITNTLEISKWTLVQSTALKCQFLYAFKCGHAHVCDAILSQA